MAALVQSDPAPGAPAALPPSGGELVPVEITWEGVGVLYKGFFSDQKALTRLSESLAGRVTGTAQLKVRYDSKEFVGALNLVVPPKALTAAPTFQDGVVDLQVLAPLTAGLARYRDDISGNYDVRVQSFVVGLDFYRGPVHCRLGVTGGFPPDGGTLSPCVHINGDQVCGQPTAAGVQFSGDALTRLQRCLH